MATFLDALSDLVSDPFARTEYHRDPVRWLCDHEASELCAEDIGAAEPILRRWFPDLALGNSADAASAIGRPVPAPTDLEGAIVQIDRILAALPSVAEADASDDGAEAGAPALGAP